MAKYTNVTSSPATTTLITRGSGVSGNIRKITIANFSDNAADAVVNLFLQDAAAADFYFIKNVSIPKGATLVLEDNLTFDVKTYSLIFRFTFRFNFN